MQKIILLINLMLFCFKGISQTQDLPISQNIPKRGIYRTFEEFKFNVPSITDSFYVVPKLRTQKNWEKTWSHIPKYANNSKRVKKVWGFSDGQNVYAFHQWEFFKVKLDSSHIGFYAYDELNSSGSVTAGVIGGAIGGAIYTAAAIDIAKKKKIYYIINPKNGKLNSNQIDTVSNTYEGVLTKLIIYRKAKKEKVEPLRILLNDSSEFQLIPDSMKEIDIPVSNQPIKICFGIGFNQCINVIVPRPEIKYLEGSISVHTNEVLLKQVDIEVGEFYAKHIAHFQNKREGKNDKSLTLKNKQPNSNLSNIDFSHYEGELTQLIIYRKNKKEKEEPLSISLNDSLEFQLIPNAIKELDVPISRDPLKICFGKNFEKCIDVIITPDGIKYLEGSISSKSNEINLEPVEAEVGEFYSNQINHFQDKKESVDN